MLLLPLTHFKDDWERRLGQGVPFFSGVRGATSPVAVSNPHIPSTGNPSPPFSRRPLRLFAPRPYNFEVTLRRPPRAVLVGELYQMRC